MFTERLCWDALGISNSRFRPCYYVTYIMYQVIISCIKDVAGGVVLPFWRSASFYFNKSLSAIREKGGWHEGPYC